MKARFSRRIAVVISSAVFLILCETSYAENVDPDHSDSQYAYGENVGWLNAEAGGEGGEGVEVSDSKLTGYMWAENIGWISLSCENTSSCGAVDYGVTNDGRGNLLGYAWGENVGWISFSCEHAGSCGAVDYGVMIDPTTGKFHGLAWAENIGWINFESKGTVPFGVTTAWKGWSGAYPNLVDDPSDIELLRRYRDELLSRTEKGRRYTRLLYRSSEKALGVMLDNPYLMLQLKDLIKANKEAVLDALNGRRGVISGTEQVVSFLESYANEAPPELKGLAIRVRRGILEKQRTGGMFLGFEVTCNAGCSPLAAPSSGQGLR
jgi:hypothetical protein